MLWSEDYGFVPSTFLRKLINKNFEDGDLVTVGEKIED